MSTVLLVANETLAGGEVSGFVRSRMSDDAPTFTLLVPATAQVNSEQTVRVLDSIAGVVPGQSAADDAEVAAHYERARARLDFGLTELRRSGATVDGVLGHPNPFKAISEVLASRTFDEVVVFTLPRGISRWLHLDLAHRVERKFHVPVAVITTG